MILSSIDTGADFMLLGILGAIFIGILAGVVAVVFVIRNIRRNNALPEEHLMATVQAIHTGPMDKGYRIRFKTKDKIVTLDVGSKHYFGFMEGDRGELVYRGYRFISFTKTSTARKNDAPDFVREDKTGPVVLFYGEVPGMGIDIHSTKRIKVDTDDMGRLCSLLEEAGKDWFFVLKGKDGKTLQAEEAQGDVRITSDSDGTDHVSVIGQETLLDILKTFINNEKNRRQP
jgi:hypothetical protein